MQARRSLARPEQAVTSRNGNAVTTATYNALGLVSSRTDHAISSTASAFTYDWRGNELAATSPTYSGTNAFGWRFDGLVASRTWPTGTNAATFAYDRAKRPTTLTEKLSGADQAVFTQTYDRNGTVTAEGRTLSGISGIAGSGSQSFTYDPLRRVTGSSISGGPTHTFAYDANSNRTSWNDGTSTTTYDYNESDELTAQHRSGVDSNYAYDAYGNMTTSAVATSGSTSYTYDANDHVTSISPPSGGAITFTLDALGRNWTKSVGGTLTDTYGYIGASETIVRIDQAGGSISAAVDAAGNRAATSTSGGGFGWLLPDLHGSVAAAIGSSGSSVTDAFRYNAYGTSLAKTTSSLPSPWRYQGRLALNSDDGTGVNTDLYDFVARAYDPALAVFTSLDSVAGGAQNPLTLNRFVYALANPATLIDPDGHMAVIGEAGGQPCRSYWACHPTGSRQQLVRSSGATKAVAATVERPRPPCSVQRLNCTHDDFDSMTIDQRIGWIDDFQVQFDTKGYFNNVKGILEFVRDKDLDATPGSWTSVVDSYILEGIEQGKSMHLGWTGPTQATNPSARKWLDFFNLPETGTSTDTRNRLWAAAEQEATDYGSAVADAMGLGRPGATEFTLIRAGNVYRWMMEHPEEARRIVASIGWEVGSKAATPAGLLCGPGAPLCAVGAHIMGGAIGSWTATRVEEDWIDPRNHWSAYEVTSWIYGGADGLFPN